MELIAGNKKLEELNESLNDPGRLKEYCEKYDTCHPGFLVRFLGGILIWTGNIVYGFQPSYLKFRAIEVIARIPYQSWSSASYTLMTVFYSDEEKAVELSKISRHARLSLENETMHVVVISQITKKYERVGFIRHTLIPMFFAFLYFWATYWLYLLRPRWSYELNFLFEQHAFLQYSEFLKLNENDLKERTVTSKFLHWYGRHPENQYEFFRSVRNDEIIHRNQSLEEIDFKRDEKRVWFLQLVALFTLIVIFALELYHLIPHSF